MDRVLKPALLAIAFAITASPALAGDAAAGGKVFHAQCAICHATAAKAPAGVGPNLHGVVGRRSGTLPGYSYSPAMKGAGMTWNEGQLKPYLANPMKVVHGTKMTFAGLHNPKDVDDVIAYLATLR